MAKMSKADTPPLSPPRRSSRRVPWRLIGPLLSIALFAGAIVVLAGILRDVKADDIIRIFATTSASAMALSIVFTLASYLALTGYDGLALRQIGARDVPYSTAAIGSFTSYAISYTLGFPLLTAGTVRYRVYSAAGLTAPQIAALTLVCTLTFWLGMGVVLALGLVFVPEAVSQIDHLPQSLNIAIGALILAAVVGYTVYVGTKPRVVVLRGWSLPLPGAKVTLAQTLLGALDVCAGAAALYILLPGTAPIPFAIFAVIYVLAAVLGVASHAPGGIGVFEATMLAAMPSISPGELLGSLLLFRVIYYFVPFALALAILGIYEFARRRHVVDRLVEQASSVMKPIAPILVGGAAFITGAALLVTGVLPIPIARRVNLMETAPLPVVEAAHLASMAAGVALLFLSRGLLRRLVGAWLASALALSLCVVLVVLRAADFRFAFVIIGVTIVLLLSRPAFTRHAPILGDALQAWWLALVAAVMGGAAGIGLFAYRAIDFDAALWVTSGYAQDLPRFVRGAAAAGVTALVCGLLALRRRAPARPLQAKPANLSVLVAAAPQADVRLALLADKSILTSETGVAFMMHAGRGLSSIALGDPIGPPDEAQDVLWAFRERAERLHLWPVVLRASSAMRALYIDAGLSLTHIGDAAAIDLGTLDVDHLPESVGIRAWADREGLSLDLVPPEAVAPLLPQLRAVSNAWLAEGGHREGYFTLGRFDESWLTMNSCAVLRQAGKVAGFAVLLQGMGQDEIAPDIIRFRPELGLPALDFILLRLMQLAKARGAKRFDLGLTPHPRLAADTLGPTWSRVTPLLFRLGDHIADFEALRAFKARFGPRFTPLYVASPGGWVLPQILLDITALIENGPEMKGA